MAVLGQEQQLSGSAAGRRGARHSGEPCWQWLAEFSLAIPMIFSPHKDFPRLEMLAGRLLPPGVYMVMAARNLQDGISPFNSKV